jgi:hypothetical protein
MPNWDSSLHPRWPAGDSRGGEFAPKGTGTTSPNWDTKKDEAEQLLKDAGLKVVQYHELPEDLRKEATDLSAPKSIGDYHVVQAQALADAKDYMKGTVLADVLDKPEVVFLHDKDPHTIMSTITGRGHTFLSINTNYDAEAHYKTAKDFIEQLSYGSLEVAEQYAKDGDLAKAFKTTARITAWHEMAHVVDAASNQALTESWLATVLGRDSISHAWIRKNISPYATSMDPAEGTAETVSKFFTEGTTGNPALDQWAKTMLLKSGSGSPPHGRVNWRDLEEDV